MGKSDLKTAKFDAVIASARFCYNDWESCSTRPWLKSIEF